MRDTGACAPPKNFDRSLETLILRVPALLHFHATILMSRSLPVFNMRVLKVPCFLSFIFFLSLLTLPVVSKSWLHQGPGSRTLTGSCLLAVLFFIGKGTKSVNDQASEDRSEEVNKFERKTCLSDTDDVEPVTATGA